MTLFFPRHAAAVLLGLVMTSCNGDSFDPLQAVQYGKYGQALDYWYKQQEQPEAQNYIGVMHYMGLGVKRDSAQAGEWFERAARDGYAPAQFNLGIMYHNGAGRKQDLYKAFLWMYAANRQHHPRADQYLKGLAAGQVNANIEIRARRDAEPFIPQD